MTILEARFPCKQDSFDPVLAELNNGSRIRDLVTIYIHPYVNSTVYQLARMA